MIDLEERDGVIIIRRPCAMCTSPTALYGRFSDGDYTPICSESCATSFQKKAQAEKIRHKEQDARWMKHLESLRPYR